MNTLDSLVTKFINKPIYLKKGAGYLAKRFKVEKEVIYKARERAKEAIHSDQTVELSNTISGLEERLVEVSNEKGTLKSTVESTFEPKNDIELAELHKVDLTKYKISTYWSKLKSNGKFTSSLLCTLIKKDSAEAFHGDFQEFLKDYKPGPITPKKVKDLKKKRISLVLPKQDAHFNKYDVGGSNDILERFEENLSSVLNMVVKAEATNYLEEVVYVVGSDQFNSEWTSLTTKGTPQQNILTYEKAFSAICNHELSVIQLLAASADRVKVVFVPGNHDQYVGWHLIDWLKAYLRDDKSIEFDPRVDNTKYHRYNNTAIMLNHGDAIKPKELAQKFPMGFREQWSNCEHFYIFTGDKHHEMSLDINGIKFYQIPQLSNAKSGWDDKNGYNFSKAEMTAFVITENNGMSDIYKEIL